MSVFSVGERVWVKTDEGWWPAMIIDPLTNGLETNAGTVAVMYYGTGDADVNMDPRQMLPFELSSEKAVTNDAVLRGAIEEASKDVNALPLREGTTVVVGHKRARSPAGATTTTATAASGKGGRKSKAEAKTTGADLLKTYISQDTVCDLRDQLAAAIETGTVSDVRRCLLKLGGCRMSFSLLTSTKVGVVVGTVLRHEEFGPLFALTRALLGDWISKLPQTTLEALNDEVGVRKAIRARQESLLN